jgi:hypothetical protein
VKGHLPLISALFAVLILTAACFGGGASEPSASEASEPTLAPTSAPTQASEPTATTAASAAQATETAAPEAVASDPLMTAVTVEDAPEILSYRTQISIVSESPRGAETVQINGAYIKEPPAEQITVDFNQGGQTQQIETLLVDGTRFMRNGDTWMQTPGSAINVGELTLLTPQNAAGLLGQMTLIGTENVNAVSASHYQGSKEIIPVVGTEGDTLDVSQIDAAQLDLWVDDTYHAIVRLMLTANNVDPAMAVTMTYDYTDLNSDIQITMPESVAEPAAEAVAEGDFVPKNELGELLGFNLMFPTGATVETVVGANLYVIVAPFTIEEAPAFVEANMQANGYSQISKNNGPTGEVIYLFQREQKAVSVTLTDAGDGNTRFQFATGP